MDTHTAQRIHSDVLPFRDRERERRTRSVLLCRAVEFCLVRFCSLFWIVCAQLRERRRRRQGRRCRRLTAFARMGPTNPFKACTVRESSLNLCNLHSNNWTFNFQFSRRTCVVCRVFTCVGCYHATFNIPTKHVKCISTW